MPLLLFLDFELRLIVTFLRVGLALENTVSVDVLLFGRLRLTRVNDAVEFLSVRALEAADLILVPQHWRFAFKDGDRGTW